MRSKILKLAICIFVCISAVAQPVKWDSIIVDSITASLRPERKDTAEVRSIVLLAQMYLTPRDSAKVMYYSNKAEELARELNDTLGIITSLSQKSFFHAFSDWPHAIIEINDALKYCEGKFLIYQIPLFNNMTIVYGTQGDYALARQWSMKARNHLLFETSDDFNKWATYMQLGRMYDLEGNLDSAEYYGRLCLNIMTRTHHDGLEQETYVIMGNNARKRGQYDKALMYYRSHPALLLGIAQTYFALHLLDSARYYGLKAYDKAFSYNQPISIMESSKFMSQVYENTDPKKSIQYLKVYNEERDKFFNNEKLKNMEALEMAQQRRAFDLEQKETQAKNRIVQLSILSLAFIFIVVAIFLYRNNRIRKANNEKLQKAYAELKQTQAQLIHSEKMASLGTLTAGIAHEIQNPLNFVNNFSELNSEMIDELKNETDPEEKNTLINNIKNNLDKILSHGKRAESIVRSMLQHSRSSGGEKEPADINLMVDESLRLAFHGLRSKDKSFNSDYHINLDPDIGSISIQPQEISRVLLNIFNNAFYAVNEKSKTGIPNYKPCIEVSTNRRSSSVEVVIEDNGNGIPSNIMNKIFQPFFTTKPTGEGTGLGLSLSYDIVAAHNGNIQVNSIEGQGTKFTIMLPLT